MSELVQGLLIIGVVTAAIVGFAIVLARKEEQEKRSEIEAAARRPLRRAS